MSAATRPVLQVQERRQGHPALIQAPLFVIAGCGLLVSQKRFVLLDRTVIVWLTFAGLLLVAACGYRAAKAYGWGPWVAPVSVLSMYYFWRYGVGTVVAQYWSDFNWTAYPLLRYNFHRFGAWSYIPQAAYLVLIFGMGMAAGGILSAARPGSGLPALRWRINERKLKTAVAVYAPFAIFINSYLQFLLPLEVRFFVGLFGSIVYPLIILGARWLFLTRGTERSLWLLFVVVVCAGSIPVGLINGQVAGLLLPMVMVGLGYTLARGRPPWMLIIPVIPLMMLIVLPLSAIYKTTGKTSDRIDERVPDTLKRFANAGSQARVELALERSLMRFSGTSIPAIYARYYPQVFPFEFGRTMEVEASSLVPRIMWPDKPFASYELNKYAGRVGMVQLEGNTTALFDAVSEYYLNFGAAGMFLLAMVHGYCLQAEYRWLVTKVHPVLGSVIMITLLSMNEDFYGLGLMLTSHLKTIPVWLALLYIFTRTGARGPA